MARLADIFDRIGRIGEATVDQAMIAALPSADPEAVKLIVPRLLLRRRAEGLLAVVLHFHQYDPALQAQVCTRVGELYRALREAARHPQPVGPSNALDIIQTTGETRLGYLVAELLIHGQAAVRHRAAAALLEMTRMACRVDLAPEALPYLVSALSQAVQRYASHQRGETLIAALELLPRPLGEIVVPWSDAGHPATVALGKLLRHSQERTVLQALVPLLALPPLRESCVEGLRQAVAAGQLQQVLRHGHLLLLPALAAPLRRQTDPQELLGPESAWLAMPAAAAQALARWATLLPLERALRLQVLVKLASAPDAMARLGALRRLIAWIAEEARRPDAVAASHTDNRDLLAGLAVFCHDSEPAIARLALRELVRRRWEGLARLMPKLVNSDQPELARIARHHLAALGFARLWEAWPRLDSQLRTTALRAVMKLDPDFRRVLLDKLQHHPRSERLRAVAIIDALGQADAYADALIALVNGDDPRLASAAVKALGGGSHDLALPVLQQALAHADARVRANAVDALRQRDSRTHVEHLVRMALADANRPRASAIAHLMDMRAADALTALQRMLADDRPEHRRSALWIVDSMGLIEVARQVAEMSISDPQMLVKQRAGEVVQRLIQSMHSAARSPRPTPESVPASSA
jgi:hypothetical protein